MSVLEDYPYSIDIVNANYGGLENSQLRQTLYVLRNNESYVFENPIYSTTPKTKDANDTRSSSGLQMRAKDFLASIPSFADFTDQQLITLEQKSSLRRFEQGEVVFRQGEEGDMFYVINQGAVDVLIQEDRQLLAQGDLGRIVNRLTEGCYFGERALMTQELRAASIRVISDTVCLVFTQQQVVPLRQPPLVLAATQPALPQLAPACAPAAGPVPAQTLHLSPALEKINRHCRELLRLVARGGFLQGLRPDAGGELRLNVPFCGSLSEATTLAAFALEEVLPSTPGAGCVRFYCADVRCCGAQAMVGMIPPDARLRFEIEEKDLASVALPPAELAIGFHPQPLTKTPDRLWERIIEHVLRSSKRCLFTCWMLCEAEELLRLCRALGSSCSLQRNPCPLPEGVTAALDEGASMRFHYIVLTKQAGLP